ncbi:MAG: GIY-YIG nuclease family protein [Myxococcales bacterium]
MARPPEAPWFVYFLRCRDGSLYAGATNDLARRLLAHNRGRGAAYTRSRRPVRLAYWEEAGDRSSALRREAALKRLPRRRKLELVAGFRRAARRPRKRRSRRGAWGGSAGRASSKPAR